MIYQSVSIENVISKVIRETKVTDSSAIMELYEIIPDAIGMMQTRFQLHHTYKDLCVHFHKTRLPAGLLVMPAVEYHGHRLPWKHSARAISAPTQHHSPEITGLTIAQSLPLQAINPVSGNQFTTWSITDLDKLPCHDHHYYWVEMGYLSTSFSEGCVRIHYYEAPKDENGNLLIPDNSFYREAIYYYCRAKLIGMGVFEDRIIGEEKCMQRFELNAGRAIDEIDYPTEDQMRQIVANQVRLVPPNKYWEDFGGRAERTIYG